MENRNSELISIIVPVYNIEKYIRPCIESIIGQTYENLQIILVNDGSTDLSPSICDEYEKKDKRVQVIHKKNGGVSEARNVGLNAAAGNFIGFVDGDDWIEADMYEKLYSAVVEYGAELAFGVMKRETGIRCENMPDGKTAILDEKQILDAFIIATHKPHILKSVCDKLYRRETIGSQRFKAALYGEDGNFNTKVLSHCARVVFVGSITNHYRDVRTGNSSEAKITEGLFTDRIPIAMEQIEVLKSANRPDLAERQTCVLYNELLRYYLLLCQSEKRNSKTDINRLKKMIHENKAAIRNTLDSQYAGKSYRIKMRLFLICEPLFLVVMHLITGMKRLQRIGKERL